MKTYTDPDTGETFYPGPTTHYSTDEIYTTPAIAQPTTITFRAQASKEIMRIEKDRIWVDPDVEVTEAARLVLDAMEWALRMRDRIVWNEAVEAAVAVAEGYANSLRYNDDFILDINKVRK